MYTLTLIGENGVNVPAGKAVVGVNLSAAAAAAKLRQLHAAQAWAGELEHPPYAALHYAGLAAIEQLAASPAGHHAGYLVVPVQFGCYVVT